MFDWERAQLVLANCNQVQWKSAGCEGALWGLKSCDQAQLGSMICAKVFLKWINCDEVEYKRGEGGKNCGEIMIVLCKGESNHGVRQIESERGVEVQRNGQNEVSISDIEMFAKGFHQIRTSCWRLNDS